MSVEMTERKLSFAEEMRARAAEKLRVAEQDESLATSFVDRVKREVHDRVERIPRLDSLYVETPENMSFAQLACARTLLEAKENGFRITPFSTGRTWVVSWKK
jgi:hypothetical protein